MNTQTGITGYGIIVDGYKDSLSVALRRYWNGKDEQPHGYFNAPSDTPDNVIKELTAETRREKKDSTGRIIGVEWYRPSGRNNELWDLLVYASCGLDMCVNDVWYNVLGNHKTVKIDHGAVFDYMENENLYRETA